MQKSVLIVEDNELNMKLFNDLLEAHGYKTVQTRSGVEGRRIGANPHAEPHFDGYSIARRSPGFK